jgi:hypothetical protein
MIGRGHATPWHYQLQKFSLENHVIAIWKNVPDGIFEDWNLKVSCQEYTPDATEDTAVHDSHP